MNPVPTEISNFFLAMQAGKAGAANLESCFAEDATYSEPFTGAERHHRGRAEIMKAMAMGWDQPLPDMTIHIDRVDTEPGAVLVHWTCRSPGLPGGIGRGRNRFTLKNGLIASLTTTFA